LNGTGVGGGVFTGAPAIAAARVRTVVIDRTTNANARLIQNGLFFAAAKFVHIYLKFFDKTFICCSKNI
jgi:hypothetical protein